MNRAIWLVLPFVINLAYLFLLIPADSIFLSLSILTGVTSGIFLIIYILNRILKNSEPTYEQTKEIESSEERRTTGQNPILILSGIYGVVAGFAIITALQSAFVPLVGQPRSPLDLEPIPKLLTSQSQLHDEHRFSLILHLYNMI